MRLYIVPGVSRDTVFETQTRKEISKIAWFKLSELPTWKQMNNNVGPTAATAAASSGQGPAGGAKKFYLVTPFIGKLKQWIGQNKKRVLQAQGLPTGSGAKGSAAPTEPAAMRAEPSQQLGVLPKEPCVAAAPTLVEAASPWPLTSNGPTNGNRTNAADLPKQDDSAALLAMLQGSLHINPPPPPPQVESHSNALTSQQQLLLQSLQPSQQLRKDNDSPLPAPRPQKSSGQTLKLLEMLSPRTPQAPEPQLSAEDSAAEDMARKRQALLQGLMGAGSGPSTGGGYTDQGSQQGGQEQQLLDMLRGQNTSQQQVAPQNALHPSFHPHEGGQYGHPPPINGSHHLSPHIAHLQASHQMPYPGSPDAGRSDLLAMLNAGPMQRNGGGQASAGYYPGPFPGHQYPPQHQPQPNHNSTHLSGPPQFAGHPGHQQQGYIPPPPSFGPAPPHAHAHISHSPQYGHHPPQQHAFGQLYQEPSNMNMTGHNVNPAYGVQQQHAMSPQMHAAGGQQPSTGGVGTGAGGSGGNAALLAMLNGR